MFSIRLLAPLLFFLACLPHVHADFTYQLINNDTEVEITGHSNPPDDLIIPSQIDYKDVTSIGYGAFSGRDYYGITSAIIPDTVSTIRDAAFSGCRALSSVEIPNTVSFIGDRCFRYCISLEQITIPDGISTISIELFENCTKLKTVSLPGNITSVGDEAFAGCMSLASISLPDRITSIGAYAFSETLLSAITLPGSLASIGSFAFSSTPLESISIPEHVTIIGEAFLANCPDLSSIEIVPANSSFVQTNGGVFDITLSRLLAQLNPVSGDYAIPDSVTTIDAYALSETSITSVSLPSGLRHLGEAAFMNCYSLTSAHLPSNIGTIPDKLFAGCHSLASVSIPDGVVAIGNSAFFRCRSLESLSLPKSVTSLGEDSFASCGNLTSIHIPGGITSIPDSAFESCFSLTSIRIPDSVTSIDYEAFYDCYLLQEVNLPASLTTISSRAFLNCNDLSAVVLPSTVTSIDGSAFSSCDTLCSATFLGDAPTMGMRPFLGSPYGFTIYFYEGATGFTTPRWQGYPCQMIPASSYTTHSTWTQSAFSGTGHTPAQTLPSADPDHDGLCNLCEYAFGGNPVLADLTAPLAIQPATDSRLPTITFPVAGTATDLTYTIQTSTDGQIWQDTTVFTPIGEGPPPMRSGDPGTIHVSSTDQGKGTHLVTERLTGEAQTQLARVKVETNTAD